MNTKIYKTLFFGTPEFAVPVLETLTQLPYLDIMAVITQPDKPVGKKQIITPPPVKIAAKKNNLTVLQPKKIKTKEIEEQIRKYSPELVIVVAYGKIIPENLLTMPKFGWLNVHASLLPKYRGASPIQGAILNGEKETGVTLMQIDAGLDSGPIIAQKNCTIETNETSQTLHDKLSQLGSELIQETLLDYLEGELKPKSQDNSQATETKIIKKEDGRIDWSRPAEYIDRQIRAYTPWPGAFCFWDDKRLKIIKAIVSDNNADLSPGQITKTGHTVIVRCGQGNLELKIIQLEGKKALPIADFLKGQPEFGQTKLD